VLFFFGWRSSVFLVCVAAILAFNWRIALSIGRSAGTWTRRHRLNAAAGACVLGGAFFLYPLGSDLFTNLSRESALPSLPPGFYLGQYNKGSPWDTQLVHYGLYVPPHFQEQKGPFPLIVFLHDYHERSKDTIFKVGLPRSIARRFGPDRRNGPFEFVSLFPIDSTGKWETGSFEVEDAMTVLDEVMRRHRIDPARVYLAGFSNGGTGVWRLAEAYPDKWAAVAPVSSFLSPDVQKVRHLPAWILHGAKDRQAPVQRERDLVKKLQEVQADVRYTELQNREHEIWREAYDGKELYDWLATKKRQVGKLTTRVVGPQADEW
jgi:predicted esterase